MDDIINNLIYPQLRKLIYGVCMSYIAIIVEWARAHNIPITEAVIENWIEILIAIIGMGLMAFWTWAKNRVKGQASVTIPKAALPEIKKIIENK